MQIICPHCTTSYAIDLATLGTAGRTVRCSRCKEVWLARPEEAIEVQVPAMAEAGAASAEADAAAEWEAMAREDEAGQTPVVDSPSISADWPSEASPDDTNWPSIAGDDIHAEAARPQRQSWFRRLFRRPAARPRPRPTAPIGPRQPSTTSTTPTPLLRSIDRGSRNS